MTAGAYDFTIEQGATFSLPITWKDSLGVPVPLVGLLARMQLRATLASAIVIHSLTTENGEITLTSPGNILLEIGADITAAFTFKTASYDLEIYDPADLTIVRRLLSGYIILSLEVTRP